MGSNFSLLIRDKEKDETSFSSLGKIKKEYKTKHIGHAGTLDKFASGLMIIMVGKATKLCPIFSSFNKRYRAKMIFGEETSTLDTEGEIIATSSHIPTLEEIESVIPSFIGNIKQCPPLYSAIHINGKRAYKEATRGKTIEMPERDITIYSLDIIEYDPPYLTFDTKVSKGTYIRSLSRDIALNLNSYGHLVELRRTEIGPYTIDDSALSTKELLDKTELFSNISLDILHKKEIDNGQIKFSYILSDSDKGKKYAYLYFENILYGIGEKLENKLKIIERLEDGDL